MRWVQLELRFVPSAKRIADAPKFAKINMSKNVGARVLQSKQVQGWLLSVTMGFCRCLTVTDGYWGGRSKVESQDSTFGQWTMCLDFEKCVFGSDRLR